MPVRGSLSLGESGPQAPRPIGGEGPLEVSFAGPRGETTEGAEISVVFNKPMRVLGNAPGDPPPPITLKPAAKGAFHWVGSTALRFDAEEPLSPGTSYRVEIPAGTRAIDGSSLAAPFVFELSTPRVRLTRTQPEDGGREVPPDARIALHFSQPVTEAEIRRAVSLRADRGGAPIAFTIARLGEHAVDLTPVKALPLGDRIRVRVDASLRGARGDLPAGKDREISFHTVAPPEVVRWRCEPHPDDEGACNPTSGVTLELRGEISSAALARAVVIEPAVKWDRELAIEHDYPVSTLDVRAEWKPGTTYRLRVRRGPKVTNTFGQQIQSDGAQALRFGHLPSGVRLGLRGTYWSASRAKHALSAFTTNTQGAALLASPRSLDELLRALGKAPPVSPAGAGIPLTERGVDEQTGTRIDLDALLPGARGAVDLVTTFTPPGARDQRRGEHQVQITDLGISARVGHGSAAVLVTHLDDGSPIGGASVELYRKFETGATRRLATGIAGPEGDLTLRFDELLAPTDHLAIVARRGSDWTLRSIDTPRALQALGSVYFERGLYRPGETARLSGVFRVPVANDLVTPRRGSVHVVVSGPSHQTTHELDVALSDFGTFTTAVPIPREGALGWYHAEATFGGGRAEADLQAAEYRPTELTVEVSTDRPTYTRGDTMRCRVRGRYLHGGAMAGTRADVVVMRSSTWFDVPDLDGFSTQDQERRERDDELSRVTGKLDARGEVTFPVALALPRQTGASYVTCAAEVMDLNRQALAAEAVALVHPGDLYVALGVRTQRTFRPGDALRIPVLAVTPAGERRAAKVQVELWRRDRSSEAERRVDTCDVTTGATVASCSFTVPRDAPDQARLVVRAAVADDRGRVARASEVLEVEVPRKPPPPAAAPKAQPPAPRHLEVRVGRDQIVGQTGHIDIESPFARPSRALVTVEREGILWQRTVEIPGERSRVDFPVLATMIPNAHVSVTLVSDGEVRHAGDSIEVDIGPKKLKVSVAIGGGEAHAPGEAVDVEVTVRDADGKPAKAEITLWAADEGTLSLTHYLIPEPQRRVLGWRWGLVTGADSRDDRVQVGLLSHHRATPPLVRMGATHMGRAEPRSDFRQTAFFAAHLVTDDGGKLKKRFTLPDGLTTYRVMAVAVGADDRFGSKQASVVTSLPLMARASLPRVIRAGDRFEASVVLTAKEAGGARLTAEATGLTLEGPRSQTLALEAGAPSEVRFLVRADRAGAAKLTVQATQGKAADAVTVTREVVTPMVPESVVIDGETADAAAEGLGDLSAIRPDHGGLEISLSSTPLAGLADGVEQLISYPYGCTEQTVSRLVPLLALRDLAESLGAALPAKAGAAVDEAVRRLVDHQRRDGGFGLWRESPRSDPGVGAVGPG